MREAVAVEVTIDLNETDKWHRPLDLEILNYLRKENVYAATAIHCVAGFPAASAWKRHIGSRPAASCR